jgi:hypothetical protein
MVFAAWINTQYNNASLVVLGISAKLYGVAEFFGARDDARVPVEFLA